MNDEEEKFYCLIKLRNFIIILFIYYCQTESRKKMKKRKHKKKLYLETDKQDISSLGTLASYVCHKFVLKLNQ